MPRPKKILFIPALFYLSNKLFTEINKHLQNSEAIYLDCNYVINNSYGVNYESEIANLRKDFSQVISITENLQKPAGSNKLQLFQFYLRKKKVHQQIIREINKIMPDLIVLTSEYTDSAKIISHSFKHIPLLNIQQCSLVNEPGEKYSLRAKIRHSLLKHFFLYPTTSKNPWKKNSAESENFFRAYWSPFWAFDERKTGANIHYTGNGALDEEIEIGNNRVSDTANYDMQHPRIVYTSQPLASRFGIEAHEAMIDFAEQCLKKALNCTITIKVHPREDLNLYIDRFKNFSPSKKIEIVQHRDLTSLLSQSDLLITGSSMTSYQAMTMGVPVIALNPNDIFNYQSRYPDAGIQIVKTPEEFLTNYKGLFSKDGIERFKAEREEFLKQINTYTDSNSSRRIAGLINDIVGNAEYD